MTFSLILCSLTSIKCQIRPDFCATSNFDGVFYLGQNITFKNGPQFWQYDSEMQRTLPRVFEDIVKVVTTSLFINEVPNCDKLKDCQQLKKALNVIFIRMIDINTFEETTRMARFNTNYELADVTPEQYPWGLTDPAAIWPKEWNNNPIASKPSLFLPYKNQVYFITNHNEEYSELHYRTIDSTNWYQSMSKNRLTADIRFAGMFHTYGAKLWSNVGLPPDSVFAVGHIKKHPKESKLFRLDSNYTFVSEVS